MPVISNTALLKYKTYYTERVKGKDGVTRPLTKVKYVKPCTLCGGEMALDKYKKGGVHKSPVIRWLCNDKNCNHSEREQSYEEHLQNDIFPSHDKTFKQITKR